LALVGYHFRMTDLPAAVFKKNVLISYGFIRFCWKLYNAVDAEDVPYKMDSLFFAVPHFLPLIPRH